MFIHDTVEQKRIVLFTKIWSIAILEAYQTNDNGTEREELSYENKILNMPE